MLNTCEFGLVPKDRIVLLAPEIGDLPAELCAILQTPGLAADHA